MHNPPYSLEWSRIEPEQGVIDTQAVERFRDIILCIRRYRAPGVACVLHFIMHVMCIACHHIPYPHLPYTHPYLPYPHLPYTPQSPLSHHSQGMEPVVTLHHFVHPQWFEKLGAFEKTDNLPHFMRFVDLAAREYGSLVHMWLTFNEPSVYTFFGYIHGTFPPAKPLHLQYVDGWGRVLGGGVLGCLLMIVILSLSLSGWQARCCTTSSQHTALRITK